MNTSKQTQGHDLEPHLPSLEKIQQELDKAQSVDDFFGKKGIFARLFSETIETMLESELTEHLGHERHEAKGRNSGNSRNGKRSRTLRTSGVIRSFKSLVTATASINLVSLKNTRLAAMK
jgi:hypothetical protein